MSIQTETEIMFDHGGKSYTVTGPMRAKAWLWRHGEVKSDGKGRMSYENHVLLQFAYEQGQRFTNWGPEKVAMMVTETTDSATGETTEITTAHRIDGYQSNGMPVELAPYLYNHDTHAAYETTPDGTRGQRRTLKEVCANDGVSLVQCTCGAPKVVATDGRGHVSVVIVAETSTPPPGSVWDLPRKR